MAIRLVGLTEEARRGLGGDELVLPHLPFKIGRENRLNKLVNALERRIGTGHKQLNDIYLVEDTEYVNVSREHLVIEEVQGRVQLRDLASACGTIVEGEILGGERAGGVAELHDHDVIIVGTSGSPFVFKFRK
jgi:pSer/pThr/pTyr-binding forkhead associated (FHA) protein